ncbi:MAG: DUF885 domain-containing protein [Acidimicrobiales bacterium]|nr:DUF885 domain-containing protein [Acidimicrobiales bacterium]
MTSSGLLEDLTERYWQARLEASPLTATFLGDHRYDDRLDDLSEEAELRQRQIWVQLRDEANSLETNDFDETDRVTHRLLVDELSEQINAIDDRFIELGSDQMQGIHAELLTMVGQLQAPEPEHAAMAVVRTRAIGTMLDQATDRFRAGLKAGRTPARTCIDRSINQIDGYLASPIESDPFVNLTGPSGWDGEQQWRDELRSAVEQDLRPAYQRYRAVLSDELAPVARDDDHAGLCWIDGGIELYKSLIRMHTGLDIDPQVLHDIGMKEVTEKLPGEFIAIGQRAFGTSDLKEIFDHLLNDADLRYRDGEEILADAQRCLEDATNEMGNWFTILPEAPCELIPVPDYLAADAPAAYYMPPAPDGSRPGNYCVNLHNPTTKGRAETASIAFHEAIPGHHLQLAIATERSDLPAFRRLSWSHTAYVEGWALYTERLAEEMGLYRSDIELLGMLASDAWRACRLVVDTGLHALGWTRQQAIDFMVANAPVSYDEIVTEIDRYIAMPAQALAYKVGQREIMRLRAESEARLGDRFDISKFHDVVLGAATISLTVLAERVEAWDGD